MQIMLLDVKRISLLVFCYFLFVSKSMHSVAQEQTEKVVCSLNHILLVDQFIVGSEYYRYIFIFYVTFFFFWINFD